MKKKIILILLMFAANSEAQVSQQWALTFNGTANSNDEAAAIIIDGSGNSIVTGRVLSTGNNNDFCTIKYNPGGTQEWAKTYNSPSNKYDEAIDLVADASGNIYVAGISQNAALDNDITLVKYNSAGDQQWAQSWNSSANLGDYANGIAIDNSGNVFITGYTEKSSSNTNYITLKYNSSGMLQWEKEYTAPINSSDIAYHIKTDPTGNVYVTGTSTAMTTGPDFLTIKYNSLGDSLWVRRYSGTNSINEIPYGFAVDQNGNSYITGFTQGPSNSVDYITFKYNSSGVQQWIAIYDTTGQQDIPEDVAVDALGNVYVTGRSRVNTGYNDFATIKYNSSGVRQWIAIYDNPSTSRDDYGYDVEVDATGNVYVAGYSQVDGGTGSDATTIKYNSAGIEQWVARYEAATYAEAYALALDNSNNVYVTGYKFAGNADYLTIKYSQTIGIKQISSTVPAGFSLSQNYPNPFNPVTNLEFGIANLEFVTLNIYDAMGRKIETLVNEKLSAGVYKVDFNGNGLPSGTYFYKLQAGNFVETKKMMLLK